MVILTESFVYTNKKLRGKVKISCILLFLIIVAENGLVGSHSLVVFLNLFKPLGASPITSNLVIVQFLIWKSKQISFVHNKSRVKQKLCALLVDCTLSLVLIMKSL